MRNKPKDLYEYQVKIYYFENINSFPSKKKINKIIKNMGMDIFHQFLDMDKEIPPIPKEYNKYKNYNKFIYSNIFEENMKYYLNKYIERIYYIFFIIYHNFNKTYYYFRI